MLYWKENLSFFEKSANDICQKIKGENIESIACQWQKDKNVLLIKQGKKEIYSASIYNVKRETKLAFENCDADAGLVVVLGIGNIELIKNVKKHFTSAKKILIFEPSISIFNETMKNISAKKFFSEIGLQTNVFLNEDMSALELFCNEFVTENKNSTIAMVVSVPYAVLFPDYAKNMLQINQAIAVQESGTLQTARHFRYSWAINEWRNLKVAAPDVSSLKPLLEKLPVVVVSAGPSLNKNIHLIEQVQNKALIVAVGSAVTILANRGIKPHIIMSTDGSVKQSRIFREFGKEDAVLIYANSLYYKVPRKYDDRCIEGFFHNSNRLKKYIYDLHGKQLADVSTGPSVANNVVFLALSFGCKKIILMGQDLCYTDGKNYADGSWANAKDNESITYLQDRIVVKNIYGHDVTTKSLYLSIKQVLENACAWYPDTMFINATEGGLDIKGYSNKPFSLVIQEDIPEQEHDIKGKLDEILENSCPEKQLQEDMINKGVGRIKKDLLVLQEQNKILHSLIMQGVGDEKIGKIKKYIDKMSKNNIFQNIFPDFFWPEKKALDAFIAKEDLSVRKNALYDFAQKNDEHIDFLLAMAEEILSGEEKQRFVFWV